MSDEFFLLALLFFLELGETTQYRGKTFNEAINNLYLIFKEQRALFILFHLSFFYILYISVSFELFNIWTITILLMKVTDFALKIYLFRKIESGGYFDIETYGVNDMVLDWKIRYLSVVVYTGLFIPALF